ncbi:amino acid adenylation domain-containing protein [Actinocrinis puniceicyclus]|uniref:Amino acid adenylation domain-containing protein n=1 Tax=Actinocrinis puniceicyclus TaxID=977794 RepID=A0A8J7WHN3_9ACTN|nr:non-ribosomal peptide synthetase [Actinocrinis puniceicyclus]MBS2962398.1 amino acid adenylation domain-containing protein [Actinocrinis puniceicyclus]
MPPSSLHALLRRRASERPDSIALVGDGFSLTYRELDDASDGLAVNLREEGVNAGDLVPALLPRGVELVTAVLAILKVGAAYALLDPEWPRARLDQVLEELKAPLLIGPDHLAGSFGLPVRSPAATRPGHATRPEPVETPDSAPCCVFFTSGTTGRPKGVLVPHRAVTRLFRPGTFARFDQNTVIALAAPTPWDAFALELWSALANGGTSVLINEPYLSAGELRRVVAGHGVNTVWLTASLFNMIVDEDPAAFRGLHHVMTGGERLSGLHVRRFLEHHPDVALLNGYGPVESTVFATTHRITARDCEPPGDIPIGSPVPGTEVYVLDGTDECETGRPGEICVGGDGLAIEYLNDADLTRRRFPETTVRGRAKRLYRTGDRGWWDADRFLHYGGRLDRQVKIRGHRIEPAEVESQIERHLDVRRCVVLPRTDSAGRADSLAAFCVPVTEGDQLTHWHDRLSRVLVPYHLPRTVVSVAAFPLTANGKLDERALLALAGERGADRAETGQDGALDGVTDDLTRQVAAAFAAVLGRSSAPLDVSLPALGGTSLDVGRVCARLSAELGRPVPISRMLENPTVSGLVEWLRRSARPGPPAASPPPGAGVPLTSMQIGFLTRQLLDPDDRSAYCLNVWRLSGSIDLARLAEALGTVQQNHEALRARYVYARTALAHVLNVPAPEIIVLPEAGDEATALTSLRAELNGPLDLDAGQVWRAAFVPLPGASGGGMFGYVVHHIAYDGWSEHVLAEDLAAAYNAADCGDPPTAGSSLAEAWAIRSDQRALCDLERHQAQLVSELSHTPDLVYPPVPAGDDAAGPARAQALIGHDAVNRLDTVARAAGVTRFCALMACYGQALAELTGQRDFAVGVPVARRADGRLARSVGCHVDMVCVRLRGELTRGLSAAFEVGQAVERALATQEFGFGEVVRLLNPPRTKRTAVFQNILAYQDNAVPRLDLNGLRTTHLRGTYPGLPAEIQTDVWPSCDGLLVCTNYLPAAVAADFATALAARFAELIDERE